MNNNGGASWRASKQAPPNDEHRQTMRAVATRRALVVLAHPVPESFVAAAADRLIDALQHAGYLVDTIDLYAEEFDPVLRVDEYRQLRSNAKATTSTGTTNPHAEKLRDCDTLALVYPTWFGAQPAILKGWFDRVWIEGVAYRLRRFRRQPLLRNIRTLLVVTSHGSPKIVNAITGEAGKRVVGRGLRSMCHPRCRVRWLAFYGNDRCTAADRERFLDRVTAVADRLG